MAFKNKETASKYYILHRKQMIQKSMKYNKILRHKLMQYVYDYLASHPCVECGESDVRVLEFDHVRGIKRTEVMRLASGAYGWNAVKEEIKKCDIRCANCHRRKTAIEFQWYKNLDRKAQTLRN
mgnify:CR=1 FL=1